MIIKYFKSKFNRYILTLVYEEFKDYFNSTLQQYKESKKDVQDEYAIEASKEYIKKLKGKRSG